VDPLVLKRFISTNKKQTPLKTHVFGGVCFLMQQYPGRIQMVWAELKGKAPATG